MNERENELFEEWWENEGQYHRAGGDEYCKTFAYHAWESVVNREGYKLVPLEMSWQKADDLAMDEWNNNKELFKSQNRDLTAIQVHDFRLKWCRNKAHQIMNDYKAMIGAINEST